MERKDALIMELLNVCRHGNGQKRCSLKCSLQENTPRMANGRHNVFTLHSANSLYRRTYRNGPLRDYEMRSYGIEKLPEAALYSHGMFFPL